MIGETLGNYRVVQKIGTGGMGVVYLAVHPLLGKKAVIKLLLPQFSHDPQVVMRFFHEAQSSATIGHPGIVDIFDYGQTSRGDAYLVMEYLEGESLTTRLKREKRLATPTTIAVARQLANALGAAHQKGIVHRDLKPDNVFLVPDRDHPCGFRVKVLDFGIAKLARAAITQSLATNAGAAIGTPKYMSPEQCLDAATVDQRADIYSLGCLVFEMACGRPPFAGEFYAEVLAQHIASPPPAPSSLVEGVPQALEAIILRTLEKDLSRRYPSMEALAAELDRVMAAGPPAPTPALTPAPFAPAPPENPPSAGTQASRTEKIDRPQKTSTTLGGAASELRRSLAGLPVARRRAMLPAAILGVALGLALVAIAIAVANDRPVPPTAVAHPVAAAGPAEDSGDPARSPTTSPMVTLRIESDPPGAEVARAADGVVLGTTPLEHHAPRGPGDAAFVLKKPGYRDARLSLASSRDGVGYLPLEKMPKSKHIAKGRKEKTASRSAQHRGRTGSPKRIDDGALDPFGE